MVLRVERNWTCGELISLSIRLAWSKEVEHYPPGRIKVIFIIYDVVVVLVVKGGRDFGRRQLICKFSISVTGTSSSSLTEAATGEGSFELYQWKKDKQYSKFLEEWEKNVFRGLQKFKER